MRFGVWTSWGSTEAAEARIHLGRCYWELERPDEAMEAVEQAREALEQEGPSAELALAYIRIAGFHAFRLDYDLCREAAERGAEIAEQASADFERVWALSFVALGWFGTAREFELFGQIYEESIEKGYSIIAGSTTFTTRSGIASTRLPAGLAKLPRDMTACHSSHGRSGPRSEELGRPGPG